MQHQKSGSSAKGIIVENDCQKGRNVTIWDDVTIGKGSVIGAKTLVTKDILSGSVFIDKREEYKNR